MGNKRLKFWMACFIILILLPVESKLVDTEKFSQESYRVLLDKPLDNEFLVSNALEGVINIEYDSNFTDYGFLGDGSASNPYRIEDYVIDTLMSYGIKIWNTTKHVLIQNCTFWAVQAGIRVSLTEEGTIKINNNTCDSFASHGLMITYAPESTITNNLFISNEHGIYYDSCPDSLIANNTFTNNHFGIRSENNSTDGVISGNYFSNNDMGIFLGNAPRNQITENIFLNNYVGIILDSTYPEGASKYCEISYNLIENSTSFGLVISAFFGQDFSSYNEIHHNSFVNNNLNGKSQAIDDGVENLWSKEGTRIGNYWSDWWGIGSYKINGTADNKDRYPISKPLHTLQTPVPTFLKGRAILFGILIPILVVGYIVVNESRRNRRAKGQQIVIEEEKEKVANKENI